MQQQQNNQNRINQEQQQDPFYFTRLEKALKTRELHRDDNVLSEEELFGFNFDIVALTVTMVPHLVLFFIDDSFFCKFANYITTINDYCRLKKEMVEFIREYDTSNNKLIKFFFKVMIFIFGNYDTLTFIVMIIQLLLHYSHLNLFFTILHFGLMIWRAEDVESTERIVQLKLTNNPEENKRNIKRFFDDFNHFISN